MSVLLSIKPKYADLIFSGEKQYEFRRTIFKNCKIKKVVVYASSPVSKVIGEFEIDDILSLELSELWSETMKYAGIDKDFYDKYFDGKKLGYAIKIKKVTKYKQHKNLHELGIKYAPQSFVYL
jgi:predicted transcriptional regulator